MSRKTVERKPGGPPLKFWVAGAIVIVLGALAGVYVVRQQASAHETTVHQAAAKATSVEQMKFDDVKRQSKEFLGYYRTIKLTPEQEAVKKRALEPRPAACCKNSSAYTCCCTCNLSKTVWGLTNYAIVELNASEADVNRLVDSWLAAVNPSGYDGETCYQGGCGLPGSQKGCGGMTEGELAL